MGTADKAIMHRSLEAFKKKAQKFLDDVEQDVLDRTKQVAGRAFRKVVLRSPVWTGQYVQSHRIGVGTPVSQSAPAPVTIGNGLFPPKMSGAKAAEIKEEMLSDVIVLEMAKPWEKIFISNIAAHARLVEYVGWPQYGRPAYHVYSLTALELKNEL